MAITQLLEALVDLYPEARLLRRPAQLLPFASDGLTAFRVKPAAVVLPEDQQEVIDTVRLCHQYQVPFVARGSGTSLSGGSLPIEGGLVIALNRLNRVLDFDPDARVMVVEPGMINRQVSRIAAPHGLHYAPDPSSGPVCTIGGNLAFNSGGAHCLKHGMTANHVLGLKVVLPDGEVVTLGSDSLEAVGPDLVGMFIGSEGLFGIALEATLRLLPKVESTCTLLAAYHSLAAAGQAVAAVIAAGLLPGALEIMDRLAMDAAEAAVAAGYPVEAQGLLIVELEGTHQEVMAEFPRLRRAIDTSGAYQVRVAENEEERARIWKGRKGAFSAVGRLSPDYLVQDGVVPRSRLGEALAEIKKLSERYRLGIANVFHAGDGNLHPLILFDGRRPGELEKAEELAGEILRLCIRLGGSITGEHGVGVEKRAYLPEQYGQADLDFMMRLRRAVDPRHIANRGKMLPLPQEQVSPAAPSQPPEPATALPGE